MIGHVDTSMTNNLSWTKSVASSSSSAVSISATNASANGSYKIGVSQLAENFSVVSNAAISVGATDNLVNQFGLTDGTDVIAFTISGNGNTEEFAYTDLANTSIETIVDDINSKDLGVSVQYDATLDRLFFQTDSTGTDATVSITNGTTLYPSDDSNGNVVDFLTTADGTGTSLTKIADPGGNSALTSGTSYAGLNAVFSYNGVTGIEQQSNTFTMNGLEFGLTAVTTEDVTVNVSTNVDEMYDKISDFVDKYNDMMGFVNTLVQQKKDREFDPLTSAEKEDLSEDEIKTYLAKAKVGVISNDITINSITAELRNAVIDEVTDGTNSFGRLNEVGIMNAPASGGGKLGKLELDEDKLRAALADDPDKVMDLFFHEPENSSLTTTYEKNLSAEDVATKREQSGIFNRISDILSNGITTVIGKAGYGSDDSKYREVNGEIMLNFTLRYSQTSTLDSRDSTLKAQIEALEDRMEEIEDNYYKMFAAMESSLSKMNSQSAWLQSNMM
jgi:flagellar hook-associated protein 2